MGFLSCQYTCRSIAAIFSTIAFFPVDTVLMETPIAAPWYSTFTNLGTSSYNSTPPSIPNETTRSLLDRFIAKSSWCYSILRHTVYGRILDSVEWFVRSTIICLFVFITWTLVAPDWQGYKKSYILDSEFQDRSRVHLIANCYSTYLLAGYSTSMWLIRASKLSYLLTLVYSSKEGTFSPEQILTFGISCILLQLN